MNSFSGRKMNTIQKSTQKTFQPTTSQQNNSLNNEFEAKNSDDEKILRLDPQQQGYQRIYHNEQQFQLRFQQQDDEKQEILQVRVSQSINESTKKLMAVKVELMSEIDIFFHQRVIIDEENFQILKQEQKLNMPFFQIPNLLIKALKDSLDPKNKIRNILSIQKNGKTHLSFEKQIDFAQVILLQLDLVPLNETEMKHQVMYKYNVYKVREKMLKFNTVQIFDDMKQSNTQLFEYTIRSVGLLSDKI